MNSQKAKNNIETILIRIQINQQHSNKKHKKKDILGLTSKLQLFKILSNYNINQLIEGKHISQSRGSLQNQMNLTSTQQLKLSSFLGKGGFSKVYLEKHQNKLYACKQVNISFEYPLTYLFDEINSLRSLKHPNIVQCYGFRLESFQTLSLILQYIQGDTIDQRYSILDQEMLFFWIFQLALALKHLKQNGIVHRDIKSRNIMVNEQGIIKLIDFGVSKIICNKKSQIVGSHFFIAPEIVHQNFVCFASDIWSLGITFYQLIYKSLPLNHKIDDITNVWNYYNKIKKQEIIFDTNKCSEEMISLLKAMLQRNPRKRITPLQILNHPSIKSREEKFIRIYESCLERQN